MSAFGGKADIAIALRNVPTSTKAGGRSASPMQTFKGRTTGGPLFVCPGTGGLLKTFFPARATHALEVKMTTIKGLAIVALLIGGTSLALAQGPPTGGYPPVSGGAGGNPATNPVTPGPP